MDVADFADVPVIYNPLVPDEFMSWFWLADIRSRREAQLEPVRAADKDAAIGGVTDNAVMVTLERARARLPPQLKPVGLTDSAPVQFYAARRCDDRNALLRSLFAILEQLKPIQF